MPDLVFLRHGQSTWNAENRFTGWTDVDLTTQGEAEASAAGRELAKEQDQGLDLRVVHTSVLTRAVRTANLALEPLGRVWLPVRRSWRLNERHYGALQGLDKKETSERFGLDRVKVWRRSYDVPPPALELGDERHPRFDDRYRDLDRGDLPATECLADVVARMVPYWNDEIVPDLHRYGGVLVVAHGNSIRAAVKFLMGIPDEEITELEIPTGVPWLFRFTDDLELAHERQLGDPEAIRAAAEAVARQAG
ncbi:MAG: 2,3-diphosphoglycerate-dependent phosphoglycerate mutase [Acidimicrobiales bacterium]